MDIIRLDTVDSTNLYAKEHIEELNDKTVVIADKQTAGRGRLNRQWQDNGSENIYGTIVLKPSVDFKPVYANLTQYFCVCLSQIFEEYNVKPSIKWPNDIRVNSKKISGVLAESVVKGKKLEGIVLGFGVNLNCEKADIENINQPATSLNLEIGDNIDKEKFLIKLFNKFCLNYNKFIDIGFPLIKEDYIQRADFLKRIITVNTFNKRITGYADTVDDNGTLVIVDKNNNKQNLYMGDIL